MSTKLHIILAEKIISTSHVLKKEKDDFLIASPKSIINHLVISSR